jgi:hypothetical protein
MSQPHGPPLPVTGITLFFNYFYLQRRFLCIPAKEGLRLELHLDNLVDQIWRVDEGRPPYPSDPLFIISTSYAGKFH